MASFILKSFSFIQALRGGKQPPGLTRESSTVDTSVAAWLHVVWADLGGKEREAWLSRTPLNPNNETHEHFLKEDTLYKKGSKSEIVCSVLK